MPCKLTGMARVASPLLAYFELDFFSCQLFVSHLFITTYGSESESELFTGDTSKDNHSPGPVFREVSP